LTDMLFHYLGQSVVNTVYAFIWPLFLVEFRPPVGIALLVAMYIVFPRFFKAPIERWLFDDTGDGTAGTD